MDWPKCEICNGTGDIAWNKLPEVAEKVERDRTCCVCNGTGEAKELTEDQAGDFLKSVYDEDWYLRPDGYKYAVIYDGDVRIGEGRNIREALTTAALTARTIKEREEK